MLVTEEDRKAGAGEIERSREILRFDVDSGCSIERQRLLLNDLGGSGDDGAGGGGAASAGLSAGRSITSTAPAGFDAVTVCGG
jgi:hypothetical protein